MNIFLTKIFMKLVRLVLFGTDASVQSSAIVWERLLKEMGEDEEGAKEFKQVVASFLIPDKVSPIKFRANWIVLSRRGMPSLLDDDENINPTPSLERFTFVSHRPLGYPGWFLAGYPDVASWVTDSVKEDESIFRNIFGNISVHELLDSEGLIKGRYLRTLIDTYSKKTGRTLECSE